MGVFLGLGIRRRYEIFEGWFVIIYILERCIVGWENCFEKWGKYG